MTASGGGGGAAAGVRMTSSTTTVGPQQPQDILRLAQLDDMHVGRGLPAVTCQSRRRAGRRHLLTLPAACREVSIVGSKYSHGGIGPPLIDAAS